MPNFCRDVCFRVGVAVLLMLAGVMPVSAGDDPAWSVVTKTADLTISQRPRLGTKLREFMAVGNIAAPTDVVKRVLDDVPEYPHFMPYVVEAKVLAQDGKSRVTYQRLSPPLVGDRDYAVRVKFETRRTPEGTCYCNRWQAAPEAIPAAKKGVSRVSVTEGYWLLEPIEGNRATRATYFIFSDSGSPLPSSLINAASRTAIPKIFDAVRRQSRLEKYTHAK